MKNNWSYLLELEDIVKKDNNIAIILDKLFGKFTYIEKHKLKNEIIITAKDSKSEYVIVTYKDSDCIYIALEDINDKLSYEIKMDLLSNDKVRIIVNSAKIDIKNGRLKSYQKTQNIFKYDADLKNNTSSAAIDTSICNYDCFTVENNYTLPDLRCVIYIDGDNEKYEEKKVKYFGDVGINSGFATYDSKLPACLLLQRRHERFLNSFKKDYNRPPVYSRKNKIGF